MRKLMPAAGLLSGSIAEAAERPNILFIMSDDHAAHAISAYGGRQAETAPTPNIDRLASEGALFTNAFCTNSICSPSRDCVPTGQYNHMNGAFDLSGKVEPGKQLLAIPMRQAGYHTAIQRSTRVPQRRHAHDQGTRTNGDLDDRVPSTAA